jgi:predicted PurR-regulated permease PerM
MGQTARRAFVATIVSGSVVVVALALWKLRVLLALLFLAFIIAAAMRPGIDALKRRGVPRGVGVAAHYLAFSAVVALLLSLVVPRATDQVQGALDAVESAGDETGVKRDILVWLDDRLEHLPEAEELVDPAVEVALLSFEIFVGIFFVLACAAYWIFER